MGSQDVVLELHRVPPFDTVPPEALEGLHGHVEVVELEAGDTLVRRGEVADAMYALTAGRFVVHVGDDTGTQHRLELEAGSIIGEIGVVAGGTREATVTATTPGRALRLPGAAVEELAFALPELADRLAALAHARLRENQLVAHLARLVPAEPADLRALATTVHWRWLRAGEVLCRQDEPAGTAYLPVNGRLRATRVDTEGRTEVLGEVGRGELVGEAALLEDGRRNATLTAVRDTEVACLSRDVLPGLLDEHPRTAASIARMVLERSRRPPVRSRTNEVTIGVFAAHPEADVAGVTRRLVAAMRHHADVAHVSSHSVDAELGRDGIAQTDGEEPGALRLARWFEEVEDAHELVVLEADREATPWTRRVARMAEHVVVLADATTAPELTPIEQLLADPEVVRGEPRRSLVLLHPPGTALPSGTRAWLERRMVDRHHHVRADAAGDLGRLARHLAGAAVGVALSGGGARGFGHVGAVRALRESGVPLDVVAGSSMGCAVGVIVALDHPTQEAFHEAVRDAFTNVLDYTLPSAGLIAGKRIATAVERTLGGRDLEDLPIPFLGVSTNLTEATRAVHRRGDPVRVVRASVAIPGVIPPVVIDGTLHVDGGVLDNLPLAVVRDEVRSGTVIAIDVAPPGGPRDLEDFGTHVSGWRQLRDRLLPGRRPAKVPGLAATAMRSLLVASTRERDRALAGGIADLYVNLGRLPAGLLDFDALDRVAAAGYDVAREPVAAFADAADRSGWA